VERIIDAHDRLNAIEQERESLALQAFMHAFELSILRKLLGEQTRDLFWR
jgi:hypothetical protein